MRWLAGLLLVAPLAVASDAGIIDDPRLAEFPGQRGQLAWQSLFEPGTDWLGRQVAWLSLNQEARLRTLWLARLLYRGDPWTRRPGETASLRRWRAGDREVRQQILRDIRWRRSPEWLPVLDAVLAREADDPAAVVSALVTVWMIDPQRGIQTALRIADPRRSDALPSSGLPGARARALSLLVDAAGPGSPPARAALEWVLTRAVAVERNAALALLPEGSAPDLVTLCLTRLADEWRAGRLDDDATAGVVLACTRLGVSVPEAAARVLAEMAAGAPREIACAAAASLARAVTWQNALDPAPLAARLARESDPAVRHALLLVLLRLAPARITEQGAQAGAWNTLARHRLRLQDWAWQQFQR